jgi:hypothetical protein
VTLSFLARLVLATAFVPAAGGALAGAPDEDWARFGRDVDANTFLVGHPASPRWTVPHANQEHPAVVIARQAAEGRMPIDANTFIVQPPATVTWLRRGDAPEAVTVAGGRGRVLQ